MKKIVIIFVVGLLTQQIKQAQGTVYLSNLGQSFSSSNPVASDFWLAASFATGANPTGYLFDSVDLGMANATGSPGGFTVMLYSATSIAAIVPRNNLGTLNGSTDPSTAGIYTYTDDSNIILSPDTLYFIVLTANTSSSDGDYEWDYTSTQSYNPNGGWLGFGVTGVSSNGSVWRGFSDATPSNYSAIAITATPIPEPSPSWLILLGSGILFYVRRAFHRKF